VFLTLLWPPKKCKQIFAGFSVRYRRKTCAKSRWFYIHMETAIAWPHTSGVEQTLLSYIEPDHYHVVFVNM